MEMPNNKKETHESYGMISVSRFYGGHSTFFGSSIKHSGGVSIEICEAEVERSSNRDWYHHKNLPIVKIEMSYNQFAEMLTANMNTSGTPCTITRIGTKSIERPKFVNRRLQLEEEFKDKMKTLDEKLDTLISDSTNILSSGKVLTKKDKETIMNEITMLKQEIRSNLPFIHSSFNEQIDKTVTEAKGEIEGFYEAKIRNLGIEALQDQIKVPEIEEK
jgi:hypothetical protein